MNYKKITIITNTEGSDLISGMLFDYSEGGIAINDGKDYYDAVMNSIYDNPDNIVVPDDNVIVTAFITMDTYKQLIDNIIEELSNVDKSIYGPMTVSVSDYQEDNDPDAWKEYHKPIEYNSIVILPEWYMDYSTDKHILKISIGSSFGTGQHETTSMVIGILEGMNLQGKNIVDLGCGSGILGLSALKLGAHSAYLCDIENVDEAAYNAYINDLADKCTIETKDLSLCDNQGDIVICNIYAPVLCQYKYKFLKLMNDDGILILSGIYNDALEDIKSAYNDMTIIDIKTVGDWTSMVIVR